MDPVVDPAAAPAAEPATPAPAADPAVTPAAAAPAVPESYTFNQVDGVELHQTLVDDVTAFAKDLGLSQEAAQKFMDRELQLISDTNANATNEVKTLQDGWRNELQADPDFGGDNYEQNQAVAKTALEAFFPALTENAEKYPFLDHPAVMKGLHAIGQRIAADGDFVPSGNQAAGEDATLEKRLFPNMK